MSWLAGVLLAGALAIGGLAQSASVDARPRTPLEQTLIANSHAVAEAQKTHDANGLKRLLATDFQQVGSEGRLHDVNDLLEDMNDAKLKDYSIYNVSVVPVDEDAAIVTYDCVVKMSEGDGDGVAPRYQRFSDLWVKQGEQWRLKFQQATPRRPVD